MKIVLSAIKAENFEKSCRIVLVVDGDVYCSSLWFEFDSDYRNALVTSVCDGFLIALFPYCILNGIDVESMVPATRAVLQNIEALVSLLVQENRKEYRPFRIVAPVVESFDPSQRERGVLASGSCGVDALHTLWASENSQYYRRPTHVVFNNTGSNLAGDNPIELLCGRIRHSREFAAANGYGFIYANSNYSDFVGGLHYSLTNFYVNLSIGYLLANGFKEYVVSSGYKVGQVLFHDDPAHAESVLVAYMCVDYFRVIHIAGDFKPRFNKVMDLVGYEPALKYLNVCFVSPENCGFCGKCRRVLMALECLGGVENFANVFDLSAYERNRDKVFVELILDHWRRDAFIEEMWPTFRKLLHPRHWVRALMLRLWIYIISIRWLQWLNLHTRHRDSLGE